MTAITAILDNANIPFNVVGNDVWFTGNGCMMSIDNFLNWRIFGGGVTLRFHRHNSIAELESHIQAFIDNPKHWQFN